jgi:hypothetical protein
METAVHVGVREGAEPLGVLLLEFLHVLILLKELGVRRDTLGQRWGIRFEVLTILPVFLDRLLDVDQVVPFVGL